MIEPGFGTNGRVLSEGSFATEPECYAGSDRDVLTMSSSIWLRIAIGSAVLAASLAASLLARAQSGPGWEVPADVVMALTVGPKFTIGLIVIASLALVFASRLGNVARSVSIGTIAVILIATLLTVAISDGEPEQWPVRHANASAVVGVLFWPTLILSGVVFWLLGFYLVAPSSYRGAGQVVGAIISIIASIIGVLLCLAGLYYLIFMTY